MQEIKNSFEYHEGDFGKILYFVELILRGLIGHWHFTVTALKISMRPHCIKQKNKLV